MTRMLFLVLAAITTLGAAGCAADTLTADDGGSTDELDAGGGDDEDAGGDDQDAGGDDQDAGGDNEDAGGDDQDAGGDDQDAGGDVDAGPCPTGMSGPSCEDCAPGFQDEDDDGACTLSCDATGAVALDCGAHGTCEDASGTRACECEEGWDGATCAACATGWELVDGLCEPALGVTSGLRLWYDADHDGVVTNGAGEVSTLPSRATTPFPLTGPLGVRPTLVPDAIHGRSVIRFDAGERLASTGSTNALSGADYTMLVVVSPVGLLAGQAFVSLRTGTNYGAVLETAASGYRFVHRSPIGTTGGDAVVAVRPLANPHLVRVTRSASGAIDVLQLSVAEGGNVRAHEATTPITQNAVGGMHAFVLGDGPAPFTGSVAEVLVYDRALTSTELTSVAAYLDLKWDVQ